MCNWYVRLFFCHNIALAYFIFQNSNAQIHSLMLTLEELTKKVFFVF